MGSLLYLESGPAAPPHSHCQATRLASSSGCCPSLSLASAGASRPKAQTTVRQLHPPTFLSPPGLLEDSEVTRKLWGQSA